MSDDNGLGVSGLVTRAPTPLPQVPRFIGSPGNGIRPPDPKAEIRKAATDFEALLLQQMVQSMWQTVPDGGEGISGSREELMYRDMLTQEVSKTIAAGQGIGIRAVVERELTRQAEANGSLGPSDLSAADASKGVVGSRSALPRLGQK